MASKIRRLSSTYVLTLTNSSSSSEVISFNDESGLVIYTPASWTSCTVAVYAENPQNGAYVPLNYNGSAVSFTADASQAYALHESVFATINMRLVTDNAANNALSVGATSKA